MKFLLLLCTLALSANSFADTMECYQRSYSKTHMRNNPQQGVTYVDLTIVKVDGVTESIEAHSTIAIKEYDRGYHISTGCKAVRGGISCVDKEAGVSITITTKNKKARLEITGPTTYAEAESDMTVTIKPNSVDSVFSLNRVACD